jgi:hypothetical protein
VIILIMLTKLRSDITMQRSSLFVIENYDNTAHVGEGVNTLRKLARVDTSEHVGRHITHTTMTQVTVKKRCMLDQRNS